jgi:hypothetical protein
MTKGGPKTVNTESGTKGSNPAPSSEGHERTILLPGSALHSVHRDVATLR